MKVILNIGGVIYLLLLLFIHGCTRPEDNAINKDKLNNSSSPNVQTSSPINHELHIIEISNMKFIPDNLAVQKGDTVIWVNKDMVAHCISEEIKKQWTSGKIDAGASWKMVVNGNSSYFCAIHQVMHGKITVE